MGLPLLYMLAGIVGSFPQPADNEAPPFEPPAPEPPAVEPPAALPPEPEPPFGAEPPAAAPAEPEPPAEAEPPTAVPAVPVPVPAVAVPVPAVPVPAVVVPVPAVPVPAELLELLPASPVPGDSSANEQPPSEPATASDMMVTARTRFLRLAIGCSGSGTSETKPFALLHRYGK
jgi:hypothetical protein